MYLFASSDWLHRATRKLEVGDEDDPQDSNTSPVGRQGYAVCNRVAFVEGAVKTQGKDATAARAGRGGGVRAPPTQSVVAGSAHVEEGAGVMALPNKGGRVEAPTTQGVVSGSARMTGGTGACAHTTTSVRAGASTCRVNKGDQVTSTPNLSYVEFLASLKTGELTEVVLLRPEGGSLERNSSSVMDCEVLEDERTSRRQTRYGAAILKGPSDPYHPLLKEFPDVVSNEPPSILHPERGVRQDIYLVPGTKYCTTRQWPLPKKQVDVIDTFFAAKHAAGMVRESKSPHSSATFCVRKPNGKWRLVHAFNKLNAATIPASTPIPRKDVLQNNMAGCTVFSALGMVDGYYQLLMLESDIPLTEVSTPAGYCGSGW
ncbi:unnamed protein product [Phytophthora fragariaefolia]|uniref:Unnamed protein product n=1 Tax=Phytophthora fragariaefolia TaxID=1490495 RepID=A0A9W7CVU9_9STRA|nr:unnamed protein product [Phytophthora fragariaefolia]